MTLKYMKGSVFFGELRPVIPIVRLFQRTKGNFNMAKGC